MASNFSSSHIEEEVVQVTTFLESRGVHEGIQQIFRNNKMNFAAVNECTDTQLQELGLVRGDIATLRAFCRKQICVPQNETREQRKLELIEELQKGKKRKRWFLGNKPKSNQQPKKTRKVQLGWLHRQPGTAEFKAVRLAKGGGTRKHEFSVRASTSEIISTAKDIFFPGGTCAFGEANNMKFGLADYKLQGINDENEFCLEEYIQGNKLSGPVRLYLTSEVQCIPDGDPKDTGCAFESDSDGDDQKPVLPEKTQPTENLAERRKIIREQDEAYQESLKSDKEKEEAQKMKLTNELLDTQRQESTRRSRELRVPREPDLAEEHCTVAVRHTCLGLSIRRFVPSDTMAAVYDWIGSLSLVPENFELLFKPGNVISPGEPVTDVDKVTINMSPSQSSPSMTDEWDMQFHGFGDLAGVHEDTVVEHVPDKIPETLMVGDDDIYESFPIERAAMPAMPATMTTEEERDPGRRFRERLNDMYPLIVIDKEFGDRRTKLRSEMEGDSNVKVINITRENIMEHLLQVYKNSQDISWSMLTFILEGEPGVDMDGVKREVYSTFWEEVFDRFFEGHGTFVPRVGPDLDDSDYKTFGRIISHCYLLTGMFPTAISKVFFTALLAGKDVLTEDDYISGFQEHISQYDAMCLEKALHQAKSGSLSSETSEYLFDFFSEFRVLKRPTADTIREIVISVAKTELIAKPSVALHEIRAGMCEGRYNDLWSECCKEDVTDLYDHMQLSTSKVLSMIEVEEMILSKPQAHVLVFLKQYIRNLSPKELKVFFRYLTGSSLPVVKKIQVIFHAQVGSVPMIFIHTCSATIDLPDGGYTGFHDFRVQMDNTMQSPEAWRFTSA